MPRMLFSLLLLLCGAGFAQASDVKAITWHASNELSNQWYVSKLSPSFHLLLNEQGTTKDAEQDDLESSSNGGYRLPISTNFNWFMEAGLTAPHQHLGRFAQENNQYHMSTGLSYVFANRLTIESKVTQMRLSLTPQRLDSSNTSLGVATSYKIIQNLKVNAALDMQLEHQIMHLGLDYSF